ncbi:MAG: hypothetical protein ACOYM2_12615 [Rectinemataceae bacterium]
MSASPSDTRPTDPAERSAALRDRYRLIAHRSNDRQVAGLAKACAEQHEQLSKELSALSPSFHSAASILAEAGLVSPGSLESPPDGSEDACTLLGWMADMERADELYFKAVAESLAGEEAQRCAAMAALSYKRAELANRHLDLLGMCR